MLRRARVGRRGVIGAPVARTAAVVGTTAVVAHGVGRVTTAARTAETTEETDEKTGATAAEPGRGSERTSNKAGAHLPRLGDMEFEAWNAIDALLPRRDNEVVDRLAAQQRLNAAHRRLRTRARDRAIA